LLQVGAKDVVLELNSLSKHMAGWRVGMVWNANAIDWWFWKKSNMDSGMFYGIQKGAIET
jgi:aspartate/methionine/tyrosine aminotransferase